MTPRIGMVARVALLAALIYVLSWATSYFPGVNAAYFVAFSAGFVWGYGAGAAVGGVGMWLWTTFNPLGPAALPIALAQIAGMAATGLWGRIFRPVLAGGGKPTLTRLWLILAAAVCTATYYTPVVLTDAWVFQPFLPRLVANLPFVGISLAANVVIFPLLFGATRRISDRESIR